MDVELANAASVALVQDVGNRNDISEAEAPAARIVGGGSA